MESEFLNLGLDIIGLGVFNYKFGSITTESPVIKAVYGVLKGGHAFGVACTLASNFSCSTSLAVGSSACFHPRKCDFRCTAGRYGPVTCSSSSLAVALRLLCSSNFSAQQYVPGSSQAGSSLM